MVPIPKQYPNLIEALDFMRERGTPVPEYYIKKALSIAEKSGDFRTYVWVLFFADIQKHGQA